MYGLTRCTPNSADGEAFRCFLWTAIVTRRDTLLNDLDLPIETSSTAFDKRNVCSQAHLVDMPSCFQIVQCIENHCEAFKPRHIEVGIFDIGMMSLKFDARIECMCCLFCDLRPQRISLILHNAKQNNPPKPWTF
jgi:hypothetical protein